MSNNASIKIPPMARFFRLRISAEFGIDMIKLDSI